MIEWSSTVFAKIIQQGKNYLSTNGAGATEYSHIVNK